MVGFREGTRESSVRRTWVGIFEPTVPLEDRRLLLQTLRKDAEGEGFRERPEGKALTKEIQRVLSTIPGHRRAIPIALMVGGYEFGMDVYNAMAQIAPFSTELVLLGYSNGRSKSYVGYEFSDGTKMDEKGIWLPQEHLDLLMRNRTAPMLLIDHNLGMGANLVGVGSSLRAMGITGHIYSVHKSIWNGQVTVKTLEEIDNFGFRLGVLGRHFWKSYIASNPPTTVFTAGTGVAAFQLPLVVNVAPAVKDGLIGANATSIIYGAYMHLDMLRRDIHRWRRLLRNSRVDEPITELRMDKNI